MFAFTPFDLFFYVVAIATIASALWILTSRNIIHAAIGLLFTLFGVGGMYLMLASDFLGFLQLFIYIGATMVLIMFGIMLTRREEKGSEEDKVSLSQNMTTRVSTVLGLFVAGAVFAFLFVILIVSSGEQWSKQPAMNVEPPTRELGEKLLTEYIYAFEIISVFLMVALIGAAYLARRRDVTVGKNKEIACEPVVSVEKMSGKQELDSKPDAVENPDETTIDAEDEEEHDVDVEEDEDEIDEKDEKDDDEDEYDDNSEKNDDAEEEEK